MESMNSDTQTLDALDLSPNLNSTGEPSSHPTDNLEHGVPKFDLTADGLGQPDAKFFIWLYLGTVILVISKHNDSSLDLPQKLVL